MTLDKFDYYTGKSYFKNTEKILGNLLKNLEKSWNFVSPKKWEP